VVRLTGGRVKAGSLSPAFKVRKSSPCMMTVSVPHDDDATYGGDEFVMLVAGGAVDDDEF
jgi:hypothetical protein